MSAKRRFNHFLIFRRHAFAVKGNRGKSALKPRIVNNRQQRRGNLFADLAFQPRTAGLNLICVENTRNRSQKLGKPAVFKNDRHLLRHNVSRIQMRQNPVDGTAGQTGRIKIRFLIKTDAGSVRADTAVVFGTQQI